MPLAARRRYLDSFFDVGELTAEGWRQVAYVPPVGTYHRGVAGPRLDFGG